MVIQPENATRLVQLLVWIGGVATTVAGAWIASKIRIYHDARKAHHEDLKQKVLAPLREGLETHFRSLVFHLTPVVSVQTGAATEFLEKAKATEPAEERGDVLVAAFPGSVVFGPLDSALLHDATKRHFRKQIDRVDKFVTRWMAYSGECHAWVRGMAQEILAKSGLPAFPNKEVSSSRPAPYAMQYRLAVFVYERLFRLPAGALTVAGYESYWTLSGQHATLAVGSKEQVDALLDLVNSRLTSEETTARVLRSKAGDLQKDFQELTPMLEYAIASRKLRKRCDLVTFF
jgi:hypothetical protein